LEAKIICVIGQSGAGKTTLLNTLLNYCLGVTINDKVRYRLILESWMKNGFSTTNDVT